MTALCSLCILHVGDEFCVPPLVLATVTFSVAEAEEGLEEEYSSLPPLLPKERDRGAAKP